MITCVNFCKHNYSAEMFIIHTHHCITALQILSGTTRVSQYQKKHSPTHTHHGYQSSLIWLLHPLLVSGFTQPLQTNIFITLYLLPFLPLHFPCTHFCQLVHCIELLPTPVSQTTMSVSGWMFLLVPAHLGCPGQIPQSRKTVECVYVCVYHRHHMAILNLLSHMNKVLQMTKFSPSANCKILAPSASFHCVSWMHAKSTFLSDNASATSPALPVSVYVPQVPTRNVQPFCSTSALRSSLTQPCALTHGCVAFWLGFPTSCLCRHVESPTSLYRIFWSKMELTQADSPTVRMNCHPVVTIGAPNSAIPTIFMSDALPGTTLPLYPGLGQVSNILACIPSGLVIFYQLCTWYYFVQPDEKILCLGSWPAYVHTLTYWHFTNNVHVLQSFVSKRIIPVSVILNVEQMIKVCKCCVIFSIALKLFTVYCGTFVCNNVCCWINNSWYTKCLLYFNLWQKYRACFYHHLCLQLVGILIILKKIGSDWLYLHQNGDLHNYQFKLSTIDRVFTFAADDRGMWALLDFDIYIGSSLLCILSFFAYAACGASN